MRTVAFLGSKGGVGTTFLVHHLGWTLADQGMRVLLVDLDPQANLTAMCVDEDRLEQLWVHEDQQRPSLRGAVQRVIDGTGEVPSAHLEALSSRLAVLPGDVRLSEFEQELSDAWPRCMERDPAAFRVASGLHRVIQSAGAEHGAALVLIDLGPTLGALNRAALIAAESVATPLGSDLFSIQGLRNLGPTLQRWREEWKERIVRSPAGGLALPEGLMAPVGYVVLQPNLYGGQVTRAYDRWLPEIPAVYRASVAAQAPLAGLTVGNDPHCLAVLRHYRSLMAMAQAVRKPIFKLTAADGAIGAHAQAVQQVGAEVRELAARLLARAPVAA